MRWWKKLPGEAGVCTELCFTEGHSEGLSSSAELQNKTLGVNSEQATADPDWLSCWEEAGSASLSLGQWETAPPQTQNGPGTKLEGHSLSKANKCQCHLQK